MKLASNALFSRSRSPFPDSASHRPRLLDQVRGRLRALHYSSRTEAAYTGWIRRLVVFHGRRHPDQLGKAEVEAFLTHLAVEHRGSAATQNQALSAILFLYKEVLGKELPWLDDVVRAKKPTRLPTLLAVGGAFFGRSARRARRGESARSDGRLITLKAGSAKP